MADNSGTSADAAPDAGGETTHFGARTVGVEEKAGLVGRVFDSVAGRYDLMNDLMSGGLHRLWKDSMIDELRPRPGMHLLDVAGGTGDIAFRFFEAAARRARRGAGAPDEPARVSVLDCNLSMLEVGRARAEKRGLDAHIDWLCGDAENLPLEDRTVDAYTIAFGIRNVTRIERALAEAYRVLKPGGRFLCLELTHVALPGMAAPYDWYSFNVVPAIGQMVTGDRESYQYLVESIRRFPDQEAFADMIGAAGFSRVKYRNMSGGVVALHGAWRT